MTEIEEAIKDIGNFAIGINQEVSNISLGMAIEALEEIQQYRAIGTVEECRAAVGICKALNDRKLTPDNMKEYMKFEDECVKKALHSRACWKREKSRRQKDRIVRVTDT